MAGKKQDHRRKFLKLEGKAWCDSGLKKIDWNSRYITRRQIIKLECWYLIGRWKAWNIVGEPSSANDLWEAGWTKFRHGFGLPKAVIPPVHPFLSSLHTGFWTPVYFPWILLLIKKNLSILYLELVWDYFFFLFFSF